MQLSEKQAHAAALWAAGYDYKFIGTVLKYQRPYTTAANLVAHVRRQFGMPELTPEQFRTYLKTSGWPKCWYCFKPINIEDHGLTPIHHETGSFLCHYEPNELPPGLPYCDCMRPECEALANQYHDVHG